MKSHYWETRESLTPDKALAFLKEGNERFLNNLRINRNLLQIVNETAEKQFPFAAILSCSDSRISPELIFDQGLGDIFSIRLAGNIASSNAIGSMEYAGAALGSKLLVVLGHTNCGAVKGACDDISFGHMNELFENIRLSILREFETPEGERISKNRRFLNNVAELNVLRNMEVILESSSIIRELIENEEINLVGAMYSVETGKVTFLKTDAREMLDALTSHRANQQFSYAK
jgi:carbonic anhydrase